MVTTIQQGKSMFYKGNSAGGIDDPKKIENLMLENYFSFGKAVLNNLKTFIDEYNKNHTPGLKLELIDREARPYLILSGSKDIPINRIEEALKFNLKGELRAVASRDSGTSNITIKFSFNPSGNNPDEIDSNLAGLVPGLQHAEDTHCGKYVVDQCSAAYLYDFIAAAESAGSAAAVQYLYQTATSNPTESSGQAGKKEALQAMRTINPQGIVDRLLDNKDKDLQANLRQALIKLAWSGNAFALEALQYFAHTPGSPEQLYFINKTLAMLEGKYPNNPQPYPEQTNPILKNIVTTIPNLQKLPVETQTAIATIH